MNHSLSEMRSNFFPRLLKLSHVLVVFQLAWVRTSPQLSRITRSGLGSFAGCQGFCGMVLNGPAVLVVSYNIRQGLKC